MGIVFQSFNLVPTLTAEENVVLAAEYAGTSRGSARRATRSARGSVGLEDRAGHRPTGNLDSARTAEVLALLLMVTHDPEVGAACDRIIRMRDGLIVADEGVGVVSAAAA